MADRPGSQTKARVTIFDSGRKAQRTDRVVTEEPLEIRISGAGGSKTVAVTMRTPGADFELAAGFLFSEGVVSDRSDIAGISYCKDDDLPPDQLYNIVIVELASAPKVALDVLERHFQTTSACGVCGKANLDALSLRGIERVNGAMRVPVDTITALPDRLRDAQRLFESTGGLHAAGLFDSQGEPIAVREDVGRHNAVDKLTGWALLEGAVPLGERILMVSGRTSFEILQKAAVAGIPMVCSVSAPSSLAIDVATEFGITLIGFLRGERFNLYAGPERIAE
jgi:FdhD protein